jgi:hypothetical protein
MVSAGRERPFLPPAVARRALTDWRRAGLEPTGLHEARHTFASVASAAGVNAKALSVSMGHASVTTTPVLVPGSPARQFSSPTRMAPATRRDGDQSGHALLVAFCIASRRAFSANPTHAAGLYAGGSGRSRMLPPIGGPTIELDP